MSAPEFGQRAAHGAEKTPKPSQKCREISSSEISTNNSAASAVVVQTFLSGSHILDSLRAVDQRFCIFTITGDICLINLYQSVENDNRKHNRLLKIINNSQNGFIANRQ